MQFMNDTLAGLKAKPKFMHSKYFYDKQGDYIFRQIMHMDTYYLTDAEMEIVSHHGGKPVSVPLGSPGLNAAAQALQKSFGTEPYYIREGGSIPIVSSFKQHLGADSLLLGFGLPDDNTHSPNEKFNLNDFYRGTRAMAFLFDEISKISRDGNGG